SPCRLIEMTCETMIHSGDGSPMVLVPDGPFLMGRTERDILAEPHEKPERTVTLSAYWIDIEPVTNGRFRKFIEAGGYRSARWWTPAGWEWRERHQIEQPAMW